MNKFKTTLANDIIEESINEDISQSFDKLVDSKPKKIIVESSVIDEFDDASNSYLKQIKGESSIMTEMIGMSKNNGEEYRSFSTSKQ